MQRIIHQILQLLDNFDTLDIDERQGLTGYIDFIDINEIISPVMKGIDMFDRCFITLCAEVEYNNETVQTFTTFFKRYTDSDIIWHACGKYNNQLMVSDGGMNMQQFNLLSDLLKYGTVVFDDGTDDETIMKLRLINCFSEYKRPKAIRQSLNKYSF